MLPELKVNFCLLGKGFDPDIVTSRLGLRPTRKYRMGEPIIPGKPLLRKQDCWEIASEMAPTASIHLEDYVLEILDAIGSQKDAIKRVMDEMNLTSEIECVIYLHEDREGIVETPSVTFGSKTIAALADLGTSVDIDIYVLADK
jgi:hypothetical protein